MRNGPLGHEVHGSPLVPVSQEAALKRCLL